MPSTNDARLAKLSIIELDLLSTLATRKNYFRVLQNGQVLKEDALSNGYLRIILVTPLKTTGSPHTKYIPNF